MSTNLYAIQWQQSSSQTKLTQGTNIELCIRDKYSSLGLYNAVFEIHTPLGQRIHKSLKAQDDEFICVQYPKDFKNSKYEKGTYSWKAIVRNKSIASGKF